MCRRLAAAMAFLTLLFALGVVAACGDVAAAGSDPQIVITGNPHVSADMIRSHFHAAKDGQFSPAALDAALKSLYATGLFSDVKISRDDSHIVVKVAENPTISRLAFEGNKKVKDDDLKKLELQSKTGGPLWRAYVQGDVERMAELYRQHGYFQARITPKTIKVRECTRRPHVRDQGRRQACGSADPVFRKQRLSRPTNSRAWSNPGKQIS